MDGAKARKNGRKTLSNCGTAPLKPKSGLNGPPALNSDGSKSYAKTMGVARPQWRWILIWGRVIDPIATKVLLYLATLNKFVGNEPDVRFKRVMIDLHFPAYHVLDK